MNQILLWLYAHKTFSVFITILPWLCCLLLALLPLLRSAVWTYRQNREHSHRLYSGDYDYWDACTWADDKLKGLRSLLRHARGYILLKMKIASDYRNRIRRREHREPAQYRRPWLKPLVLAAVIGLLATVGG